MSMCKSASRVAKGGNCRRRLPSQNVLPSYSKGR
jgi:hypothetical protein